MIRVTVVYPNAEGSHFDIAYYCKTHIPLVQKLVGSALKAVAVEHGIAGGTPGSAAPYLAIGQLPIRFPRSISSELWPALPGDYGRYPELH